MAGNTVVVGRRFRIMMDTTGEDGRTIVVTGLAGRDMRGCRITTPCVTVVSIAKFRRTVTTAAAGVAEGTGRLVDVGNNIGVCCCIMTGGSTATADRSGRPSKIGRRMTAMGFRGNLLSVTGDASYTGASGDNATDSVFWRGTVSLAIAVASAAVIQMFTLDVSPAIQGYAVTVSVIAIMAVTAWFSRILR